jgi:mono/diheme cytochrome c family protein
MKYHSLFFGCAAAVFVFLSLVYAERSPQEPRGPERKIDQAKGLKAPFGDARNASAEIVAEGKRLFEGKGNCVVCHGMSGRGDGPAARMQRPHPPRDFTDCAVQKAREDGELFWIIAHGSTGTGMPRFVPGMLTEEEAWKLVAYVRSFCKA